MKQFFSLVSVLVFSLSISLTSKADQIIFEVGKDVKVVSGGQNPGNPNIKASLLLVPGWVGNHEIDHLTPAIQCGTTMPGGAPAPYFYVQVSDSGYTFLSNMTEAECVAKVAQIASDLKSGKSSKVVVDFNLIPYNSAGFAKLITSITAQ